ncbi:MAG: glycine--tRNA ligase subunit beta, partial [Sphingomicrobium sp.]
LADKLDTIGGFFGAAMPPSGSKDPFALRRSALGVIALISENQLRMNLKQLLTYSQHWLRFTEGGLAGSESQLMEFFADRLKLQQREAGVRHDLIDAVFALGGEDDLVRLLSRVTALQAFVETGEGVNLLAGYKRAANIMKKEQWDAGAVSGADMLPDEAALVNALDAAEPIVRAAIEAEDFTAAMTALASLRAPIDAFFTNVTVNDPDPGIRACRLTLLARFRDAVHTVADFSRIVG